MYKYIVLLLIIIGVRSSAQELNCVVKINASEVGVSNKQVFTTMENAIFEYINNTKWTNIPYQENEKINCSLTINIIDNPSTNQYKGSLQLQVSRPVYNATYTTSVLNFNDNDVNFSYEEYQPLVYNENSFDSNLVSILTFYVYTILGFEADTFGYKGGEEFHKLAENVVIVAQQGGAKGWKKIDGNNTRYQLNENILSPVYEQYRKTFYEYHLLGLDRMVDDKKGGKESIAQSIIDLQKLYNDRPNTFLIRVFMDTKSDEIVDVFSDGPRINITELREVLSRIFPSFDVKWSDIKI